MFTPDHSFIIGCILSLAIITYSDFKTLKIDDRRNWFMQGYTIALSILSGVLFFYVIYALVVILMNKVLKFFENLTGHTVFGDGDKKILQWLVPGFSIVHIGLPPFFFGFLMLTLCGLAVYKHFNQDFAKQPGTLYIFIAFLLTWGLSLI